MRSSALVTLGLLTWTLTACAQRGPMDVCVVDGVSYQPRESIPKKPGSCESCRCTADKDPETSLNQVSCVSPVCEYSCPEGYEYRTLPDQCCATCVQVACVLKIDNTTIFLKPGEEHYSKDRCITCTKDFKIEPVNAPCPKIGCMKGYVPRKLPDECCYKCVQVACVFAEEDGTTTIIQPGEKHTSKDGCTHTCTEDFKIEPVTDECPKIRCTEQGKTVIENCCPKCVVN